MLSVSWWVYFHTDFV